MVAKRIPPPSVPISDTNTGLMQKDWYDFLHMSGQPARLEDYPNDSQAAAGGIPLFGIYRSGSVVKVRIL